MTLAIVLFVVVLVGFVLFGYNMNKSRSENKRDAMKSGEELRHEGRGDIK